VYEKVGKAGASSNSGQHTPIPVETPLVRSRVIWSMLLSSGKRWR